jgi:NADH:ubiquinone reductase (H+-translocating)
MRHKHLIIGGGFSGLRIARLLSNHDNLEVTLVSPQNHFEYHGSLYRSANGYSPLETVIPYREIFQHTNIRYIQDFMVDMNPRTKTVQLLSGDELRYDSITLAMGYEPEYFGIPGMREFSKTLYSLADALELRKRLKQVAEQTILRSAPARVIVAGAGPTGVETAASIPHFFDLLTGHQRVEITLLESQDRILANLDEKFAKIVENEIRHSVKIRCSQKAIRATKQMLYLAGAEPMPFDVLIWTAGSSANSYFRQRPDMFGVDSKGRVSVNKYFQTKYEDVYVVGDSANALYSGTAHAAIEIANYVADHILRKLSNKDYMEFHPTAPDYAVPTGHDSAVAMFEDSIIIKDAGWQQRRKIDLDVLLLIAPEDIARAHWEKGMNYAKVLLKRNLYIGH